MLRIVALAAAILAAVIAVLYLSLPHILTALINKSLSESINTDASVESVTLDLLNGRVALNDLRVKQPEGFGEGFLVRARLVEMQVDTGSLRGECILVESVLLSDAEVHLFRNSNGVLNIDAIKKPQQKSSSRSAADGSESKAILVKDIQVSSMAFRYDSEGESSKIFTMSLTNLSGQANGLLIDSKAVDSNANAASVAISGLLSQGEMPSAPVGLFASVGPITGTNVPSVNAALRLIDLELEPLGVMFPGVREILGGNAMDVSANARIRQDMLSCQIDAKMDSGQSHRVTLSGTPQAPKYDKSGGLGLVFGRLTGVFGLNVGNIASTGLSTVGTVSDTATGIIKGSGKTVADVGSGLAATGVSAVRLDIKGAASNLSRTVAGSVGNVSKTLVDAATTLASGGNIAASTATGKEASSKFRAQVEERRSSAFLEAQQWVDEQSLSSDQPELTLRSEEGK